MPRSYCFLCASDEGVFLEITPGNIRSAFGGQIEECLSKKVNQIIELSNKICYKCAYELDQCSKFLLKSKKSQDGKFLKNKTVPYCSLCCESVENGHIFDITEDNRSVFSPLQKIRNIFSEDLCKKVSSSKLVCLVCRYNLDVLYDLKKLHEGTVSSLEALIKKDLDYSGFPKIYTDVVNRKTTITTFPDTTVYGLISSDSENDDMARGKSRDKLRGRARNRLRGKSRNTTKSQSDVKLKSRKCDQCNNIVANGMDMYRYYHTGQTVCRNCWITTDPNKDKSRKNSYITRRSTETKLCTVYLKDVLNEGSHDGDVCRVEEDKDNEKLDAVSDQSSLDENKSLRSLRNELLQKKSKSTVNGSMEQAKKRQIDFTKSDIESMPLLKRSKISVNIHKTRSMKAFSDLDQPSTSFQQQQGLKRKAISDWSSDSDHSQETSIAKNRMKRGVRQDDHLIQAISSTSEEDMNKKVNKKQKVVTTNVTKSVRSESNDESSNEKDLKKKTKVSVLVTSTRSRTRSSSISSKEMTPPVEFKSPKIVASQEYVCDKCSRKFNTKLTLVEHKLTHVKQLTLKLKKVTVPSKKEEEESKEDVDSEEDKTAPEAAEAGTSGTALDRNLADISEEIGINLDDDTDEEIFSNKCNEDDKNGKDDDQEKNPGANKNELHQEEEEDESLQIQVDEEVITSESQQCADSKTVLDETATEMNDTNDDTILINEVDASEDQDNQAKEDNVDVVENHKISDEKEKEDTMLKDDTETMTLEKTSAAEKEDKVLDDEMFDNEKTESLVSSTIKNTKDNTVKHDEDYNESFESNLENNHKNDEDSRTTDAETRLSIDLTNDYQEEDPKESEEKRFTPDITEIETLDDKEDSVIEFPKKQQNAEIEEITDADKYDDSTDNIIKPNLLDYEILDELENEDVEEEEENNEVLADVIDSNDIAAIKSKKTTEETVTANDSLTEEATPTGDVNDFELIENNVERELQEKSKKREVCEKTHNISTDTATKIMEEVFDLAAAEVQKRRDSNGIRTNSDVDIEMETLENISREIHNSADMPSLDADGVMAINDVNDITSD